VDATRQALLDLPAPIRRPLFFLGGKVARALGVAAPAPPPEVAPPPQETLELAPADVYVSRWKQSQLQQEQLPSAAQVLRSALARASQETAGFEDRLQHLYTSVLVPGGTAIDIGAHMGRHCLPMSCCVDSAGCVHAFEPNPAIAQRLRARLDLLEVANVEIHECALSDEAGRAEFVIAVDRPEESGLRERAKYNGPTRTENVAVRLERLDDLDVGTPAFIKLDTEGAEYKVLLGARQTLRRSRPVVAFEFGQSSYAAYSVDPGEVFDYFASLDYEIMSILGDPLQREPFIEASRVQAYWDYVACDRADAPDIMAVLRSFPARI
jgi:FkbM family methyltransferase